MKISNFHSRIPILISFLISMGLTIEQTEKSNSPFGNKYWMVESSTISPALDINMDGKPDTNLMIMLPACEKDDADLYQEDGMIITNRGKISCDDEDEQEEETGTWSYDPKTKKFITKHYDSRRPVEATVIEATPQRIILVSTHKSSTATHTITTTLIAK